MGPILSASASFFCSSLNAGEVTGARWDEFDLDKKLWVIPSTASRPGASIVCRSPTSNGARSKATLYFCIKPGVCRAVGAAVPRRCAIRPFGGNQAVEDRSANVEFFRRDLALARPWGILRHMGKVTGFLEIDRATLTPTAYKRR
jgi:hypothetical protein